MRATLLGSFVRVLLFWWVGYLIYWSWGRPENVELALARLSWLRETFGFSALTGPEVTVLNDIVAITTLLASWTVPVLGAAVAFISVGVGLANLHVTKELRSRDGRVAIAASWRKANVTKGPLPLPPAGRLPGGSLMALPSGVEVSEPYAAFIREVLSHLSAAPKAYAGDSASHSLYEQASTRLQAASRVKASPEVLCFFAAQSIGNLGAYVKNKESGEWLRIKNPDAESARRAATLGGWWGLEPLFRTALGLALAYQGKPELMPIPGSAPAARGVAQELLQGVMAVDAALAELARSEAAAKKALLEAAAAVEQLAAAKVAAENAAKAEAAAAAAASSVPQAESSKGVAPGAAAQQAASAAPGSRSKAQLQPTPKQSASLAEVVEPTVSVTVPVAVPLPGSAEAVSAAGVSPLMADHAVASEIIPSVPVTPDQIALKLLADSMYRLQFTLPGMQKGLLAVGVKKGRRLFLYESQLRAQLLKTAPEEMAHLFQDNEDRPKTQLHTFTKNLAKALGDKGWLVLKVDDKVVSKKSPLWRIRSGTSEFSGVLIVDWPEELADTLPAGSTTYEVRVLGPQFGESDYIGGDIFGALLAPSPN